MPLAGCHHGGQLRRMPHSSVAGRAAAMDECDAAGKAGQMMRCVDTGADAAALVVFL